MARVRDWNGELWNGRMLGFGVIITSAINYEMLAQSFARVVKQEMLYHILDNNALTLQKRVTDQL